jgi:hypothetical protein
MEVAKLLKDLLVVIVLFKQKPEKSAAAEAGITYFHDMRLLACYYCFTWPLVS